MIKKILIANRGEIANRIIRACNELNIRSVAIYSPFDKDSLHVKKAAEAYLVEPGPYEGYLNIHRLVDLAVEIGADAIHPGYGFLSENPVLPSFCKERGVTFIGPSAEAMQLMGDKIQGRNSVIKAGVPVLPGSDGPVVSEEEAVAIAAKIGYPVMVKASGGGGGRGLRVARNEKELRQGLTSASSEAKVAFDNTAVFIEKFIENPHHIEFQIIADSFGNTIHLGERDCSIQRRHQKLIEIAPSLLLDEKLRAEMGAAAVRAAQSVNYTNAGTVEFLVDENKNYYFIEMNTRIQVEHPVTEVVTGIDIVKKQIEIAAGLPLGIKQSDVNIKGYAIECRITAEDPKRNFAPNTGRITAYYPPAGIGVRIDGLIYKDYNISGHYDSMISKLIVSGLTWPETVQRMRRALKESIIRGIKTTIPFYIQIMEDENFKKGIFSTKFIEENPQLLSYAEPRDQGDVVLAISAAIAAHEGF